MRPPVPPSLAATATAAGRERDGNNDASGLFAPLGLFAVAGGLGPRGAGGIMAKLALEALREYFETTPPGTAHLAEAMRLAHRRLVERTRAERGLQGASTSLAALWRGPEDIQVGHVGDCRVYRVADGVLEQLTQDHTLFNEASRLMPDLGREELARYSRAHEVLTRNLGMRSLGTKEGEELDFEVRGFPLHTRSSTGRASGEVPPTAPVCSCGPSRETPLRLGREGAQVQTRGAPRIHAPFSASSSMNAARSARLIFAKPPPPWLGLL